MMVLKTPGVLSRMLLDARIDPIRHRGLPPLALLEGSDERRRYYHSLHSTYMFALMGILAFLFQLGMKR